MNWKRSGGRSTSNAHEPARAQPPAPAPSAAPSPPAAAPAPPSTRLPRPTLGSDTVVTGRLSFTVPTRIDGTLRGEVRATELLVIGEGGYVDGTVRAQHLIVLGKMRGDVRGADRVEIGPAGLLTGSVETRSLVVQEGGQLEGDCVIQPIRGKVVNLHPQPAAESASENG